MVLAAMVLMAQLAGTDDLQRQLAASRARWEELKAANDGTYEFHDAHASWTGMRWETVMTVKANVVVKRAYESVYRDDDGNVITRWEERGDAIGTHAEGLAPATLDGLYDECRDTTLTVDLDKNFLTLTTLDSGIVAACSYFPKDCADDCSTGFNITDVTFDP